MTRKTWYIGGAVALLLATGGYYGSAQTLQMVSGPGSTATRTQVIHEPDGQTVIESTTTTQPPDDRAYALSDWLTGKSTLTHAPTATTTQPTTPPTQHQSTPSPTHHATPSSTSPSSASASVPPGIQKRFKWAHDHPNVQPAGWRNINFDENITWQNIGKTGPNQLELGPATGPVKLWLSSGVYGGPLSRAMVKHYVGTQWGNVPWSIESQSSHEISWWATYDRYNIYGWFYRTNQGQILSVVYADVNWPMAVMKPTF